MDPSVFHAAVAQAMNAERPEPYWGIDKALRRSLARTLRRIEAMDPCDDVAVAEALGRLREVLRLFAGQPLVELSEYAAAVEFARGAAREAAAARLEAALAQAHAQLAAA